VVDSLCLGRSRNEGEILSDAGAFGFTIRRVCKRKQVDEFCCSVAILNEGIGFSTVVRTAFIFSSAGLFLSPTHRGNAKDIVACFMMRRNFKAATRTVSSESTKDTRTELQSEGKKANDSSTHRIPARTPSFMKLIRELRSRFPIERIIKSQLVTYDEEDGICHETGERLSHLDIRSEREVKQKGVTFTPQTLAISALVESEASELDDLLSTGSFDVNQLDEYGETLLHKAAMEGDVDCIRVLFKHGADVNMKNRDGWPPVHLALKHGNLSSMVYLIECGANMDEYTQMRIAEYGKVEKLSRTVYKEEEIFV